MPKQLSKKQNQALDAIKGQTQTAKSRAACKFTNLKDLGNAFCKPRVLKCLDCGNTWKSSFINTSCSKCGSTNYGD